MNVSNRFSVLAVASAVWLGSAPVYAAPPAKAAPAAPAPALDEARQRYERALELSDEGNFDAALQEFQRAYALAPSYRILFNLGLVSVSVRDYVRAIDYLTRYLAEGGAEVEESRATEVKRQIQRLQSRIATVTIVVNGTEADVSIDDVPVGKAPLPAPIRVNAGRHKITAIATGYLPANVSIEVAGSDTRTVQLAPVRALATAPAAPPKEPSRPIPWVGWGITAALAAGTAVTGGLALGAAGRYEDRQATVGTSADDLQSTYRGMRALSITSDVLLVGTVVAAGISTYLTLRPPHGKVRTGFLPGRFSF